MNVLRGVFVAVVVLQLSEPFLGAHACPSTDQCFSNADCTEQSSTCLICNMPSDNSPNGGLCIASTEYCNTPCETNYDCADSNHTGQCAVCVRYNNSLGWGRCRQAPSNCGAACSSSYECTNECSTCIGGVCSKTRPNQCGATCYGSDDCPSSDSGDCIACVNNKCVKPACGSPCSKFTDCILSAGPESNPCTRCHEGRCQLPSNASLTCGASCGEGQGHCTGDCSVCVGYCYNPHSPPQCGTPCNYGYPCPDSGECDYCSPDACTTFAAAKASGRVWPEHRQFLDRDKAPPGSRMPPPRHRARRH